MLSGAERPLPLVATKLSDYADRVGERLQ